MPTILGRCRLFLPYRVSAVLAALNDDGRRPIVTVPAVREPATDSGPCGARNKAHSTVSYHLDRLDEAGGIERDRAMHRVSSRLIHKARETLRQWPAVLAAAVATHSPR